MEERKLERREKERWRQGPACWGPTIDRGAVGPSIIIAAFGPSSDLSRSGASLFSNQLFSSFLAFAFELNRISLIDC